MLIRKEHNDHIHIYSDCGKRIKHKASGKIYSEAIESKDCVLHNEYEEVE